VLVYSIASRSTFERLEVFRQSMLRVKREQPIFMLVGNKSDKAYEREVSKEEGLAMARSYGCEFLETSAKTAQNVERMFTNLVRTLRLSKEGQEQNGAAAAAIAPGNDRPQKAGGRKKKGGCVVT
jgi:GTPase KRas